MTERPGHTTIPLATWDSMSEENRRLKVSLAAIHYHSSRGFSDFGDEAELYGILMSIHDECEEVLPELKTL